MTTFQRNAIIAGYINSFCLVCESSFETEEQIFSHIRNKEHEAKLLLYPYLEKFENNGIMKVKAGYFCAYCSKLMTTGARVNLHIAEEKHYSNKGNCLLKRSGSVIIAFDNVLITESVWHSFADDACAVCDAEFDDPNDHKIERAHVIKLLQYKVEFVQGKHIYRKINKNQFQCLTCNCVAPLDTLEHHFNEDSHNKKYIQCQEEKRKYDLSNTLQVKTQIKTEIKETVVVKGIKVMRLNNRLKIENVTGIAVTEQAIGDETHETKPPLKPDVETKKKTTDSKKIPETIQKDDSDPATYAENNRLAYDPRNRYAFCKSCEKKFPSTLRGMKEHILGRDHIHRTVRTASKSRPKRNNLQMKTVEEFAKHVTTFDNTIDNDTVINESICVNEKSFHTYTKISCKSEEFKCQICLKNLNEEDLEDHCATAKHERGIKQTYVVSGLKNEFVREVRPESFHCGYCNLMIAGWKATEEHLKTEEHKTSTATCNRRLQMHLPAIRALKNDDVMKSALFQIVVNRMN